MQILSEGIKHSNLRKLYVGGTQHSMRASVPDEDPLKLKTSC